MEKLRINKEGRVNDTNPTREVSDYANQTKSFTNGQLWSIVVAIVTAFMLVLTAAVTLTGKYNQVDDNTSDIIEVQKKIEVIDTRFNQLSEKAARQDEINTKLLESITKLDRSIEKLSEVVERSRSK